MAIHKIREDDDTKTLCGKDIWKEDIEASVNWQDVTCKKCRNKKTRERKAKI